MLSSDSYLASIRSQGQASAMATDKTELASDPWVPRERFLNLHEAHNTLTGLHHDTTARLNKLERRLNRKLSFDSDSDSDASSEASDLDDDYKLGFEENVINEARDMDFEHFKNRYTEHDGKCCIEVLVAGSNLGEQVRQELKRRGTLKSDDDGPGDRYEDSDEQIIHRVRIQSPSLLFLLCSVLGDFNGQPYFQWKGQNRTTFYRPFTWFIYAQAGMKAKLEELEKKFSEVEKSADEHDTRTIAELISTLEQAPRSENSNTESPQLLRATTMGPEETISEGNSRSLARRVERNILERALLGSYQTLLALRCYVNFVEERIIPTATRYETSSALPLAQEVRYQDLYDLFQIGELVHVVSPFRLPGVQPPPSPLIGRICDIFKPDATVQVSSQEDYVQCVPRRQKTSRSDLFKILLYTIDYDGVVYGAKTESVVFRFFNGTKEVTSLPAYPLLFHPNPEELTQPLEANGHMFLDAVASKHTAYCGWSRVPPPSASTPPNIPRVQNPGVRKLDPFENSIANHGFPTPVYETRDQGFHKADYIESNAIVDVKEAVRTFPHWGIEFYNRTPARGEWVVIQDSIDIIRWTDRYRKTRISSVQDRTLVDDGIANIQSNEWAIRDRFFGRCKDTDFTKEDLVLLPRRLYAYALRERKFFSGDVQWFRQLTFEENPFENLKIDEGHVRIVQSVVWSHFQRKTMESLPSFLTQMDQDLIRGKGRGLVILLHGAPGVGKTATAEAVALWHKKPLFTITCGDLGFTPQGVESSLSEIFRLAHLWDCILLLDEADVFLSQRETNALQRNALVSVFLRVLEYYNGILFLTTNRVGTLDEAFKSRVHLSLYYAALDRNQTEQIMRMNLNRLDIIEEQRAKATNQKSLFMYKDNICKFAVEHWDRHQANDGEGRWNGRQIRNAVQIAASLALYDKKTERTPGAEEIPPILDHRHFETVEKTMTLFEGYMNKTKGGSATFIAKQRSERDDHFKGPDAGFGRDSSMYEASPTMHRGVGGYVPYQNRPRTPQTSAVPQSYHMTQQQPQHLSPSGSTYSLPSISMSHMTTETGGYIPSQGEAYRPAAHQQMPGGLPPTHLGPGHAEQPSSYTIGLPPSGMTFPTQDQFGGTNTANKGYDTTR
ncbi:hypothetical protein F5Y19DRAFT_418592 [Xylariaceae sp. FL1651]|nr:hypothetical protein F5Y19DRAFT_418592 [Xylariaceae sp. FL1651]